VSKKHIKPGEMSPELRDHLAALEAKRMAEAIDAHEPMCADCHDKLCGTCGECDDCEDYDDGTDTGDAFLFIQNTLELALLAQRYSKECENTVFKDRVTKLEDKLTAMLAHMSNVLTVAGDNTLDETNDAN
jgi:hypothetical protein